MDYRAPLDAIRFSLDVAGDLAADIDAGRAGELTAELLDGVLEEAARFAEGELAPQNRIGDTIGARHADKAVTMPPGWPAIYRAWWQAGWNGVDLPVRWGGMGLPTRLATATMEIWTAANMGYSLNPVLGQGAADTLDLHATEDLKQRYLEKLVTGEWCATMNLTEPQAGSDLGALTTRALPADDGSYRLFGSKIFISYGEHDLAENIVHLVLARLPDAPEGTRGISLFLVPKYLPDADGKPGARNDVWCTGIEHKLGIHASPTCSMQFGEEDGAIGWLVGEAHRGLACMFTMMNKARLFTGLQGVSIGERAYQQALAFARTRKQGRAAGSAGSSLIIEHPDVRRNLAAMRALIASARALAHQAAHAIDHAHGTGDAAARAAADERAGLLTPIVKAWCSEVGCTVASLGVQIHGGMGYVEETGAAQHFRDARITPIYEGTNGIQAIDLVLRKVLRPGSTLAETMISEFAALADTTTSPALSGAAAVLHEAADALLGATHWLRQAPAPEAQLAGASPYLRLFAVTAGLAVLLKAGVQAEARLAAGDTRAILGEAIGNARFFAFDQGVTAEALRRAVMEGDVPAAADFA